MYSIQVIATETGINAATLRKWETRYGVPRPSRDKSGRRLYTEADLSFLKEVRRRLDLGQRPSFIFKDTKIESHEKLIDVHQPADTASELLEAYQNGDVQDAYKRLNFLRTAYGVRRFLESYCSVLVRRVGEEWAAGRISAHLEHLISEQVHEVLLRNNHPMPADNAPVCILATMTGERHTLGLRMADAALAHLGFKNIYLGASLPVSEIVEAVRFHQADYVGISITQVGSAQLLTQQIKLMNRTLGEQTQLLIGGSGSPLLHKLPDNVSVFATIASIYDRFGTEEHDDGYTGPTVNSAFPSV